MLISVKSEQCRACYWFNTAVYILVQIKQVGKTNGKINELLNALDDKSEIFLLSAQDLYIKALFHDQVKFMDEEQKVKSQEREKEEETP